MNLTNEKMIEMLEMMIRIRCFEEQIGELTATGLLSGFVHLYTGEEAVATGVCAALRTSDYITSTHRGHGHLIAKGGKTDLMMAELYAKKNGYCKGKGGSMHIADMDLGIIGANGIVGGGPPLAAGAALSAKSKGTDNVCVCFLGDGATNQGTVHEAMNLAAVWRLPVVFAVENNGVAEFTRQERHMCISNITDRAAAYGMPALTVDGNDVIAVYEATQEAVAHAREGKGPTLMECKTYRISGHFIGDPEIYRTQEEVGEWKSPDKDPISRFEKKLTEDNIISREAVEALHLKIKEEIDKAVVFAEESPEPDIDQLMTDVYAD